MAEVVVPAQVLEQLVVVEVAVVTELAERVSSVAGVVRVAVRSVPRQLLTVVPLALVGEDLPGDSSEFRLRYSDLTRYRPLARYRAPQRKHSCWDFLDF